MVSACQREKLLERTLDKRCKNARFEELRALLEAYGFTRGGGKSSHYVYKHPLLNYSVTMVKPHRQSDVKPTYCRKAIQAIQEVIDIQERDSNVD